MADTTLNHVHAIYNRNELYQWVMELMDCRDGEKDHLRVGFIFVDIFVLELKVEMLSMKIEHASLLTL